MQSEARVPSDLSKLLLRRLQVVAALFLLWAAVGFVFREPLANRWRTVQTHTKVKPGNTKPTVPLGAWVDFDSSQPTQVAAGRYRLASSNFVYADNWNSTSVQVTMEFQGTAPMHIAMGHLTMLSRDIRAIAHLCSTVGKPEDEPMQVDVHTMRQIWNFKFRNAECTEEQDKLQAILMTAPASDEPWSEKIADAQNPHRSPIFFATTAEVPETAPSGGPATTP